ncbi:recombinase family protein [Nonomuraea zeae]|uniref:Recombinase family protein n=1 Tax=Nonomuraea zeae TaxID=1642303 RepID=A0A5S4G476_9ACTN|nr:recombinase family protein [Nonomuraea zeae]TMR27776.1 recombinase family protein [Nonomuraea zeae]
MTTVNELRDREITVMSLTENFVPAIKEDRFMFAVLAAAAAYQLELRAERQSEGIATARRTKPTYSLLTGQHRDHAYRGRGATARSVNNVRSWANASPSSAGF